MRKYLLTWLWLLATAMSVNAQKAVFTDYNALNDSIAKHIAQYITAHASSLSQPSDEPIAELRTDNKLYESRLPAARKKVLTAAEVARLCRNASLQVCGSSINPQDGSIHTRPIASAVCLSEEGLCATNYHVLFDLLLSALAGKPLPDRQMRFVADAEGRVFPVRSIVAADPVNDFALFRVETRGERMSAIPMTESPVEGEEVFCLSHTRDFPYYLTRGIVSRNVRETNRRTGHEMWQMQLTADYGVGASGGPIVDARGNLVGIVGSTYSLYANPKEARNFQMAVKKAVPVCLLRDCFAAKPLGQPDEAEQTVETGVPQGVTVHPDTAIYGVRYRHSHLYNKHHGLRCEEERVVWVSPNVTLDAGYLPKETDKARNTRLTPTFYYYHPQEKRLTRTVQILDKEYLLQETVQTPQWNIDSSSLRMLGEYVCQKATCAIGGRTWTAWFTRDLEGTAAPRHLTGLPGVVVKASDSTGEVSWELTAVGQAPATAGGFSLSPPVTYPQVSASRLKLLQKYFALSSLSQIREVFFPDAKQPPAGVMFPSGGKGALCTDNPIEK